MAKSKSGEFYSFDEVLRQLNIDENRLKRLVSEGEIRAFREGDQMKFKRNEIDGLGGRGGRGGQTSETSLTEISLEDDSSPTVNVGKGKGDPLNEPNLKVHGGMRTAEISSQDTFIDKAGDVGMSTEPIDFTEDGGDADEVEDIGAEKKRTVQRSRGAQTVIVSDEPASPLWSLVLGVTFIIGIASVLVGLSASRGYENSVSKKLAETFFDAGKPVVPTGS